MMTPGYWRSKPPPGVRINPAHPLAQGLVVFYPFNERAGYPQDSAGRLSNVALNGAVTTTVAWNSQGGGGIDFASGVYRQTGTGVNLTDAPFLGDLTIVVRGLTTTTNNQDIISKAASSGTTATPFDFQVRAGGALTLVRSNTAHRDHLGLSVTANVIQTWGVSASRQIEVVPSFYVNGVGAVGSLGSGAGTGVPTGGSRDMSLGRQSFSGGLPLTGHMQYVAIWSRLLSAAEHAQMAADPYALFAGPIWQRFVPTVGGGPGGAGARSMVVVAG